jgi:ankyrin repeat protein
MADLLSFQLTHSIKNSKIEMVSRFLEMGALTNRGSSGHQHDHPLALAIAQGNCEIVSLLSRAGVKLTQGSVCSIADNHTANHLRHSGLMPSLIRYGGRQALISAILLNKQDLAMNLLSCNADRRDLSESPSLNCQKWAMFKTPLEVAICRGNMELAELLINRGASVTDVEVAAFVWRILEKNDIVDFLPFWNLLCSWRPLALTAIGMALSEGDHALVNRLLAAGVDLQGLPIAYHHFEIHDWIEENHEAFILTGPRCGMKAGWWNCHIPDVIHPRSVLEIAAKSSNGQSMVQDLLIYPWTSEDKGRALTIGLQNGKLDLAQILLMSNADVNQCVRRGSAGADSYWWIDAPLLTAVEREDLVLTNTLLAAGCDVNLHVEARDRSYTILVRAVEAGDMNIVKALLTAGALVNDPCGAPNALNIAVQKERLDLVVLLLEAGANINSPATSYSGRTALQLAVEKGNLQLVDSLLQAGADVNQEAAFEAGATALQLAAIQGFIGIARKLIDLGANVNAPGACIDGRTALEGAAEHGHIDTVRLLLETGASIEGNGRKQYGRAVRLAEKNAAYATANLLKSISSWTDFDSQYATEDILEDDDCKEEFVAEMTGYFS